MAWQTRAGAPLAGSLGSSKIVSFGLLGDTEEAMRAPTSMGTLVPVEEPSTASKSDLDHYGTQSGDYPKMLAL